MTKRISGLLWLRAEDRKRSLARSAKRKAKRAPKKKPTTPKKGFYRTQEWRELRYAVLAERGTRCECCGWSVKDGARMNVDHVEPVSKAWERRLDKTNLQVLCSTCNAGKGARAEDWR